MKCSLDSLAPELIQQIGTELGKDVTKLRLVCKRMSAVLESHILRSISINITKNRLDTGISQLTTLATQSSDSASATFKLHVRNLCPSMDPSDHSARYVFDSDIRKWLEKAPSPDPPDVKIAEEKMLAMLHVAIASLSNLQSLKWNVGQHDSKWTPAAVVDAMKTLPSLKSLELVLEDVVAGLQLDSLRNLESIKIFGPSHYCFRDIMEPLTLLIANSPNLHTIHVGPTYSYGDGPATTLHRLVKFCPSDRVLPLKDLGLRSLFVKLDNITVPHLRHLTSLTLLNVRTAKSDSDALSIDNGEISHPDEIWVTLKAINVHLNETDVDDSCAAFLDYISSYSGLKRLRLAPNNFSAREDSDLAANCFYGSSLGRHVNSLEELSVRPPFEGEWCFGDRALLVISQCRKLKLLEGSLVSGSFKEPADDAVKSLIDLTTQVPRLKKLIINPSNLECFRWARCGNPAMSHFQWVNTQVSRCINEYEASESFEPVPLIVADSRKFVTVTLPSASTGGVTLRYQCDSDEDEEGDY
ncbi:uncharacterized protein LACBIDRAFT_334796 [Laccaria bicolor S238N-H82]|uniref:Predicted protein n=1 Tax=Laccaria bicolor (strain S238N-H82 / ATCC MYA-4686) TaxID=486041 RepID=B0E0C1_LACBS|nr:uncharacterized protein LACBIDRAFT_334796 [Laccaria bicolor S238N-H82]EDQ99658.1 predicted protein [Laccaria bicolor S238N-H82]|eukprot:XP_001889635.1 predicted protein [Laccaria bicolor S238N-H82]